MMCAHCAEEQCNRKLAKVLINSVEPPIQTCDRATHPGLLLLLLLHVTLTGHQPAAAAPAEITSLTSKLHGVFECSKQTAEQMCRSAE
jgi:hypothetical protein